MAEFSATVYQNQFLPDGGTDVMAIVSVNCSGAGQAGTGGGTPGEVIIIDTSGSMQVEAMEAAKAAAIAALREIVDGTYFAVVSGNGAAFLAYPPVRSGPGMVPMSAQTRAEATYAVSQLSSGGGTVISTWLDLAGVLFQSVPQVTQRHAILLTDGENNEPPEVLDAAVGRAAGFFQCDCRGIGVEWKVSEIRRIAQSLLGTVDIIPAPHQLAAEFAAMMRASMSRGVADATLRVWAPQGAQVLFVRQVAPTVEDLTTRRTPVNDLTGDYPTGAWSDESRDYHVGVRLSARGVGQEQLASRVQIVVGGAVAAQGLVKATWSDDSALTARIDQQVAHYTGQTELAAAIQEGLAAKAAGQEELATTKLGRAVQLAKETGNEEATAKLRKVVEIDDAETGTVRLKRAVDKADEMALDTASTKTTRVRP
ncbi:MAG: VWA domain-containing protein [Tetrasphaera sp.]|nr:VWA domain-containing protein [Tetrasphaera sp.]